MFNCKSFIFTKLVCFCSYGLGRNRTGETEQPSMSNITMLIDAYQTAINSLRLGKHHRIRFCIRIMQNNKPQSSSIGPSFAQQVPAFSSQLQDPINVKQHQVILWLVQYHKSNRYDSTQDYYPNLTRPRFSLTSLQQIFGMQG